MFDDLTFSGLFSLFGLSSSTSPPKANLELSVFCGTANSFSCDIITVDGLNKLFTLYLPLSNN